MANCNATIYNSLEEAQAKIITVDDAKFLGCVAEITSGRFLVIYKT
jgi:hypothetical protein